MSDPWNGSIEGLDRIFKHIRSLKIPSIESFHNSYRTYLLLYFHFLVTSINMCHVRTDKDRHGHLVKWVEKSSFTHLNKLFEIDQYK